MEALEVGQVRREPWRLANCEENDKLMKLVRHVMGQGLGRL